MRDFCGDITVGLHLLYDGEPIEWCNRSGKVIEIMRRGYYIVTRVTNDYIYLKSDRKNAVVEHRIDRSDLNKLKVIEFADLTTAAGMIGVRFLGGNWFVCDKRLIAKARNYNIANR